MKTPFNVEDIVVSVFSGHATDEELAELRQWLAESEANRQLYDACLNSWIVSKAPYAADRYSSDRAWEALNKRKPQSKQVKFVLNFSQVAALFIIALSIMGGLLIKNKVKDPSSYVVYVAPPDSILQITLPDQSQVWLNKGSLLRFPANRFNTKNRDVYLDGEGFFEVDKNDALPFVVHAGTLQIKVVGTSFNVQAYPDNPELVATLVRGKIDVHIDHNNKSSLFSNQQLVFRKEDNRVIVTDDVNVNMCIVWMKDMYRFEDETFEEISEYLEKIYNVKVVFENDELKNLSFSGSFLQGQKLEDALELLREVRDYQYDIYDQTIVIRK